MILELRSEFQLLADTLEAHGVRSLSCDRDGREYCDCVEKATKRALGVLKRNEAEPQSSNPSVVPLHEEARIEAALRYDDSEYQVAFAEGYERAMILAARRASRAAHETREYLARGTVASLGELSADIELVKLDEKAPNDGPFHYAIWRAAQKAVETFDEHDAGIIRDLEAMAANQIAGFWPQALAVGALRLIRRAKKASAHECQWVPATMMGQETCLTCHRYRPAQKTSSNQDGRRSDEPSSLGGFGTAGQAPSSVQPSADVSAAPDPWTCVCGQVNSSWSTECDRCETPCCRAAVPRAATLEEAWNQLGECTYPICPCKGKQDCVRPAELCLAETADGKPLLRCDKYPECPCGGPHDPRSCEHKNTTIQARNGITVCLDCNSEL